MKRFLSHIIVAVIVAVSIWVIRDHPSLLQGWVPSSYNQPGLGNKARIQVFFSPRGGCTAACVAAIDNAKQTILVQAYSFTSKPIAEALVRAEQRKVKVAILLDKSQRTEKYTEASFVANNNIPTYIDAKHAIAHNKIMIIDAARVITGSFNFTTSAEEHNAENMLIIDDPDLAIIYMRNWDAHKDHCEPFGR